MIHDWEQCFRMMMVQFGDLEVYHARRYDRWNDPTNHLIECQDLWESQPKDESGPCFYSHSGRNAKILVCGGRVALDYHPLGGVVCLFRADV